MSAQPFDWALVGILLSIRILYEPFFWAYCAVSLTNPASYWILSGAPLLEFALLWIAKPNRIGLTGKLGLPRDEVLVLPMVYPDVLFYGFYLASLRFSGMKDREGVCSLCAIRSRGLSCS